jgi:hypothetical protein
MHLPIHLCAFFILAGTAQAWYYNNNNNHNKNNNNNINNNIKNKTNCVVSPHPHLGVLCDPKDASPTLPKVALFKAAEVWCRKYSKNNVGYRGEFSAPLGIGMDGGDKVLVAFENSDATTGWTIDHDDCLTTIWQIIASCPGENNKMSRVGARRCREGTVKVRREQ